MESGGLSAEHGLLHMDTDIFGPSVLKFMRLYPLLWKSGLEVFGGICHHGNWSEEGGLINFNTKK